MLTQFAEAAGHYGLRIHFGKTKLMTWNALASGCASISVGGQEVAILKENESGKYLGWKLCFKVSCQVELRNRINAGWAAFHKYKGELRSKQYKIQDRIRLFESVVSSTVLYGSAAWGLTQTMETTLRTAWRKMLRYVFRLHRRRNDAVTEIWSEYMKRSTKQLEGLAVKCGKESLVKQHRRRKYRFAGQVARQTDGRWSHATVQCNPTSGGGRDRGRPCTRWSDDLERFAGDWATVALDSDAWAAAEDGFVM
jgi:hypothetical protein